MPLSPTQPSDAPAAQLRIGVVGVGARAKLALHAEKEGLDAVITAVCDPHPKARDRVISQLDRDPGSVTITSSVGELIAAGIDAAFVTSPDDTHADVTCELLVAGVPVYLEKPLAIAVDAGTRRAPARRPPSRTRWAPRRPRRGATRPPRGAASAP